MKLLYATSALYPSRLANRAQILAMAGAFHHALGSGFALGVPVAAELTAPFPIVRVSGSLKSIALAWRYAIVVVRGGYTDVYCREERLFAFLYWFLRMRGLQVRMHFEAHWVRTDVFFRVAIRHADTVIAISHGLQSDLFASGADAARVIVAPDAVDLARYQDLPDSAATRAKYGVAEDAFVVAYTGSFAKHHDWKGIDTLLAAAALAAEVTFWLIGGDPEEVEALRGKVPQNVRLQGFVSPDAIPALQHAADVLVLPNKKGNPMSERHTSPLKLFEYLAAGRPIIASDLPSLREVAGDDAVLFIPPNDAAELAHAVRTLKGNPERGRALAARSRTIAERYSWDARASAIIQALH